MQIAPEDSVATSGSQTSDAGTLRELLRVALPLIVSFGSLSLMHVVDRIYLTWLGMDALAASMPAGMLHWTILSFSYGTAVYTNTFVSQYEGAGQKERIAACVWQGIWLAILGGLLLIALIPVVRSAIPLMRHEPHIVALEQSYYSVLALGSTPMLTTAVLSAYFNGRGKTAIVMWVNIAAGLFNAVVDPLLIFGGGPFPKMGMNGAALATVLANVFSTVVLTLLIWRDSKRDGYHFREQFGWNWELIQRMLRYGFPNGIQSVVDTGAYLLFIIFAGQLGTAQLAATNLAFNLNSLAFIPMFGLGLAVMTLVGRRIGEGQPDLAARTTWLGFKFSAVYMILFGVLYIAVPELMLVPYAAFAATSGEAADLQTASFSEVRPMVVDLLKFVAAYSFFDAMAIIFGSGGRGAGDVRFSLWFTAVVSWLVMVVPSFYLVKYTHYGIYGTWAAATLSIVILGIGFMWRFEAGHWRSMRVIEDEFVVEKSA